MTNNSVRISIATIGLFIISLNSPSFSLANRSAPFNDVSVVKQLKENIRIVEEDYFKKGKYPKDDSKIDMALFFKAKNIEAFKKGGYDFSKTISIMAKQGFNNNDVLYQEIILPMIIQISYSGDGDQDFLFKVFSKKDARNLIKLTLTQNAKEQNRDLPDYNVYDRDEIDLLLRKKWDNMTGALRNGDIEEALQYFVSRKRSAYRELFGASPDTVKAIIGTIKNLELTHFDVSEVGYVADMEAVFDGVSKTISSYITFERDEDGIWRIGSF